MKTPELSVFEAQQEIGSFGERIHRMFGMVRMGSWVTDPFLPLIIPARS